jgi:hypothetical protein
VAVCEAVQQSGGENAQPNKTVPTVVPAFAVIFCVMLSANRDSLADFFQ